MMPVVRQVCFVPDDRQIAVEALCSYLLPGAEPCEAGTDDHDAAHQPSSCSAAIGQILTASTAFARSSCDGSAIRTTAFSVVVEREDLRCGDDVLAVALAAVDVERTW